MDLDEPLGQWYAVPRNMWYHCYCTPTHLYWHGNDCSVIQQFQQGKVSGFFEYEADISDVPLETQPIKYQQVGEAVFIVITQSKYLYFFHSGGIFLIAKILFAPIISV